MLLSQKACRGVRPLETFRFFTPIFQIFPPSPASISLGPTAPASYTQIGLLVPPPLHFPPVFHRSTASLLSERLRFGGYDFVGNEAEFDSQLAQ